MFLGKLRISITKILLPFFFKIIKLLKASTRTANYLNDKKSRANDSYNFQKEINNLLRDEKLVGMDVGSKGGFNSDGYFPDKYNKFFKTVLIDPFNKTTEDSKKNIIKKGLWSSKIEKKLHVLNNRPDSSSMYEPNKDSLHIYGFKKKDFNLFDVSRYETVNCDKLSSSLKELNINTLDYLKIDTQGAEFEILQGLDDFRPLMIKCEVQIIPMYKNQPSWTKVVNLLNDLDYMLTDWKKIGSHTTRTPVEMDMIFIPNILSENGKRLIQSKKEKFISLMLITGQIKILKETSKILDLGYFEIYNKIEDKFFN